MAKDWSKQLKQCTFKCGVCRAQYESVPDLIEDAPEDEDHPFRYFADCPHCCCKLQPQAGWERALLKAHRRATGPVTAKGKAASAANLAGHPTPEETLRTRFNAMKHGMNARTARYFPAKPDGYSFCKNCTVDRYWCSDQPACVKQTEIFMLHHAAFEQRDPKVLGQIHADLHASLTASLQMLIQSALADGVVIKTPKVELSRDGDPVALKYTDANGGEHQVYDYRSNPVFKPIADLITRLGLSMQDLGMSTKTAEAEEDRVAGTLAGTGPAKEDQDAFKQRLLQATENAYTLIQEAQKAKKNDPVFVEFQANQGNGGSEA